MEFAHYKEETVVVLLEPLSAPHQPSKLHLIPTEGLAWTAHSTPIQLDYLVQVKTLPLSGSLRLFASNSLPRLCPKDQCFGCLWCLACCTELFTQDRQTAITSP